MKLVKKISIFISFLLMLQVMTACAAPEADVPSDESDTASAEADSSRSNHEILSDYEKIEISGEHDVRILFVNAGRADSIIIEADGLYYVIDTGEVTSVPKINAALEYMDVDKIEAVFLTHSDDDHVSGLSTLSELWDIGACYTAAIAIEMTKIQNIIARSSLEQTMLEPGSVVEVSEGLYFEVLGPIEYNPLEDNDNSLVLRMTVNGVTILFAGDMQYDEEKTLMRAGYDLRCDILKVGNHGNKDATSVSFLAETSPDYAIIITDRSVDSGTAHKSVQKGLKDIGAEIYITDEYDIGLLVKISHSGKISFDNAKVKDEGSDVAFVSISKTDQAAVIKNYGDTEVDLSRWFLISERGGEIFIFPDGAVIAPGAEITVACTSYRSTKDYIWSGASVWNKSKDDLGILVNRCGNIVDEMESE